MSEFGCLKNTIKVAAGHYVDLVNPDPDTIEIRSIASALSKVCRFGGHCPEFYSVAEHCCHAVVLGRQDGLPRSTLIALLLHDATEAYVGDMVKPLKVTMPQYNAAELRMQQAIEVAFDVDFAASEHDVKRIDREMLKAEKQRLWPTDRETWAGFNDIATREVDFQLWGPGKAHWYYLVTAIELGISYDPV